MRLSFDRRLESYLEVLFEGFLGIFVCGLFDDDENKNQLEGRNRIQFIDEEDSCNSMNDQMLRTCEASEKHIDVCNFRAPPSGSYEIDFMMHIA